MVVLVVDDSRAMRRIQRDIIRSLGEVEVLEAEDGVHAVHVLAEQRFAVDLILVDWMMPRMDGLELVKRMRANANLASIPILMVTSLSDRKRCEHALEMGADGYVLKPFRSETLLSAIARLPMALDEPSLGEGAASVEIDCEPERVLADGTREDGISADERPETDEPAEENVVERGAACEVQSSEKLFEQLPPEVRKQLLARGQVSEYACGDTILAGGEQAEHLYVVLRGSAAQSLGSPEEIAVEGDCPGISELLSRAPVAFAWVARESTWIARVPRSDFERFLLEDPEVHLLFLRLLAARL